MKKLIDAGKITLWVPFVVAVALAGATLALALHYAQDYGGLLKVLFLSWYVFVISGFFVIFTAVLNGIATSLRRRLREMEEWIRCLRKQLEEGRIPIVHGFEKLSIAAHLVLVQKLFIAHPCIEYVDVRPLPGGYGGSTTLVAGIKVENRDELLPEPYVLKLGFQREMGDEKGKYERYVRGHISNVPTFYGYQKLGDWAGVAYTFIGLGGEIQNFHQFYEGHVTTELTKIVQMLYRNLKEGRGGLRVWHGDKKKCEEENLYDEYHLLWEKWGEIVAGIEGIVDDNDPYRRNFHIAAQHLQPGLKPQFCPTLDIPWCDPVAFIRNQNRRVLGVDFYRSIVHGDLHSRNILIEVKEDGSKQVWLIDFSHTGNGLSQERTNRAQQELQIDPDKGHVLKDFCRLEADVKFILTGLENQDDFNKAISFEKELMARGLSLYKLSKRPQRPDVLRDPRFEKAWECIREVRALAKEYLCQPNDLRPYYLSLFHATLPIVYYNSEQFKSEEHEKWQKRYALVASGMLCARL